MPGLSPRWLLLVVGWTLFGAVQALTATVLVRSSGDALTNLLAFHLPLALVWAALTPAVGTWSRAIERRFASPAMRVAAHLPFLVATALLHTWLRRALVVSLGGTVGIPFEVTLLYFADLTIASYLAAVWAARILDANATLAARERQTVLLERQLGTAQMEYLELQLRPHFLFNALGTIGELAHEAPGKAARMLQNVVALLESAVARDGSGLVPLKDELSALSPYLEIQRLRFADWLVIEQHVTDDALTVPVPRFILQPLVENAVHHGLIKRTARGKIAIHARVHGDRLLISVVDNGVGLKGASSYRESRGVGLANLRARLEAVYGASASVALHDDEMGGTDARLDMPRQSPIARSAPSNTPPEARPRPIQAAAPDTRARWITTHPARAIIAAWTVVALLRIQHSYSYMLLRDRFTPEALASAIRFDVVVAGIWLVMTPLMLWLVRHIPLRRDGIVRGVLAHAVSAMALAYGHAALTGTIVDGFRSPFWSVVSTEVYAWNVGVYVIVLAIVHSRHLDAWIRERNGVAERLKKELREAHFRRVMLDLRPRVLLDTLQHLVVLVNEDAKRSERILADIGDFLRATLSAIHEPLVSLRDEGETVRAYARVLSVASAPGLSVQLSIPIGLMDEAVPTGALRVALDAVLDGPSRVRAHVQLDVSSASDGIVIRATARSQGAEPSSWRATVRGTALAAEAATA